MKPLRFAKAVIFSFFLILSSFSLASPSSGPLPPRRSPLPATSDTAPKWLADEAARSLPATLPADTEAIVLLDEQSTSISSKGVLTTACRRATRVLRPGGADEARRLLLAGTYDTKINSMTGWVINPSGSVRKVTSKQVISSSLAPDTLYMDAKIMMLAVPEAEVGSVVGFEWEAESDPPAVEDQFQFQGRFPVVRARYALTLPTTWEPELDWINWAPVEPDREPISPLLPRKMSVEIRDVPAIADEPFRPRDEALAGRLLVRLKTSTPGIRSFAGWSDMGAWFEELSGSRREPDAAVTRKAQEIAAGEPDSISKIRALAGFAQKEIRYVSIQIGVGGFQPHSASSILANRYGDCKDKATLLAALLKSIGIDSHYIIINTDRGSVTPGTPVSLYDFNHVILAVRLPDDVPDTGLDSLIRHPRLGRILVFDPTMPTTPLGRLPYYLQDNTGLLVAGSESGLVRLPRASSEGNLLERKGHLVLTSDGTLSGEIIEKRRGSEADSLRYAIQAATDSERRKYVEIFLSNSFASFSIESYDFKNLENAGADLVVSYRFKAAAYAKQAGTYLVVRPRVVGTKAVNLVANDKKTRRHPIDLGTASLARDEFTIEIPEGRNPDSLPKPVAFDAGFAAYSSRTEVDGHTLVYHREYRLREPLLPASQCGDAVAFYLGVAADEQRSLILKAPETRGP